MLLERSELSGEESSLVHDAGRENFCDKRHGRPVTGCNTQRWSVVVVSVASVVLGLALVARARTATPSGSPFLTRLLQVPPRGTSDELDPSRSTGSSSSSSSSGGSPSARGGARGFWSTVSLWQTERWHNDRLTRQEDVTLTPDFPFQGPIVDISNNVGQTIVGFGGAFTESAAVVFSKLSGDRQQEIIDGYFGPDGIGYTVGRVHINSCDFSLQNYAFDEVAGDFELRHFDDGVSRDTVYLIPMIIRARNSVKSTGRDLRMLASPWSPPAWMKTNHRMDRSNLPCLRRNASDTWAQYIARWISAYQSTGVEIWAVTVQNEPQNNAQWEACIMTKEEEAHFLGAHLGPALRATHPDVRVFVFDHNKDNVLAWSGEIFNHPQASKYADGVAFHWYSGDSFDNIRQLHQLYPDAMLLPSEATYEKHRWQLGTRLQDGDWSFGEGYAHDIIGDLNAGSVGWIDWNLLLDQEGGPNHAYNTCDAAMMADINSNIVFRHPQFYFMGHFSKFILPGSKYLNTTVRNTSTHVGGRRDYGTCTHEDGLQATAFLRPDSLIAVVVLNCGDYIIDFKIKDGDRAILARIPAHAIQTYVF